MVMMGTLLCPKRSSELATISPVFEVYTVSFTCDNRLDVLASGKKTCLTFATGIGPEIRKLGQLWKGLLGLILTNCLQFQRDECQSLKDVL
jgi:hypothetical protein